MLPGPAIFPILVTTPLPLYPRTEIITSEAEGQEVARLLGNGEACLLLGHGAVTASASGVEGAVLAMVHLEDRKSTRLNSSHLKLSRMPSSA